MFTVNGLIFHLYCYVLGTVLDAKQILVLHYVGVSQINKFYILIDS